MNTNGQPIAGDTVWYVTARSGKYMSRQLFEDKDLHDLSGFDTFNLHPQPKPEEPQEDYSKIILDISKSSRWRYCKSFIISLLVAILKAGHVGQSFGGDANKIDPKLAEAARKRTKTRCA